MTRAKADFVEILMTAAEAGVTDDLKGALYLQALAARPEDERLLQSVQARIQQAALRQCMQKTLFKTPVCMTGDFSLGNHPRGEARIQFPSLASHLLQVGGSGAGKTCNFFFWLHQAISLSGGVWVFDFFKREFRDLVPTVKGQDRELFVLRWQHFPFNPLEVPEAVHPTEWANIVSDLFTSTLGVPPVARNILRTAIMTLYRAHSVFEGSKHPPTLRELAEAIRQAKAHDAARHAILGRIETLLEVAGEVLDHRRGLPLRQLERVSCLFELDGLGLLYQNFMTACLLAAAFSRRVAANDSASPLLVSLDEGQRLYSKSVAASTEGPSFITLMTSLVRAMNIMLVVGVQTTDDLSRTIVSNSATKVLGRCGDMEDYRRMGRSMGLSGEQMEWCKVNLRPGLFIAKLTYGEHQHPFLLQMPLVKLSRRFTDAEAIASGQALHRLLGWQPEAPQTVSAPEATASGLTKDETRFLEAVLTHPYRHSSRIAPELGISQSKALKLRKALCGKGYLKEWKIDSGQRGSMVLLVPLRTVEGAEILKENSQGRGGPLHHFALGCIEAALASEGWSTCREVCFDSGSDRTFIDLLAERAGEPSRFIEFELRPDYAGTNIRKALSVGAGPIDVVVATRKVAKAIQHKADKELLPAERTRVRISMLSAFVSEC